VRPRRHVPAADVLGVGRDDDATSPQGAPPHDDMGHEQVQPPVDEHLAQIDG
jgi:hypothetical protein